MPPAGLLRIVTDPQQTRGMQQVARTTTRERVQPAASVIETSVPVIAKDLA